MTRGASIAGWGSALPETVLTNAQLEARLDTSDAWILERTGIRERRVGGTTSSLSVASGRAAMQRAGVGPSDIDLLVLSTTTPDQAVPATSATVQHQLGLRCAAFDLNAACSGFVYSLVTAHALIVTGCDRALVIGTDTLSGITDPHDRGTAVLFADGSGALVLEAVPGDDRVLGWDLGVDGSGVPLLYCDHGAYIQMDGREVFRRAVRVTVESAHAALERAKVVPENVALFVPHQANLRIIEAANQRLGIPPERTAVVLNRTGNNSAGSIPLALADAADAGRLHDGDNVLLSGFGAGMTWASIVIRWGR